jgi:hypothetical protein
VTLGGSVWDSAISLEEFSEVEVDGLVVGGGRAVVADRRAERLLVGGSEVMGVTFVSGAGRLMAISPMVSIADEVWIEAFWLRRKRTLDSRMGGRRESLMRVDATRLEWESRCGIRRANCIYWVIWERVDSVLNDRIDKTKRNRRIVQNLAYFRESYDGEAGGINLDVVGY